MTTLVTGAPGFIGSHLTRLLVDEGERVRILARPDSTLRAVEGLPLEVVRGDLRDPASVEAAVRGVRRVFHAAADYRLSPRDPRAIYETNVVGTRNLLEACSRCAIERFVYTSSVSTIAVPRPPPGGGESASAAERAAGGGGLPNEATVARLDEMVGHYKRSKFLAEREVLDRASAGLPVVIVNPTTPVGPGDWKPTPTGRIILDFLRGRMVAYVETGLNLVPVEDVAAGHLLAAARGQVGERYILGGPNMRLKAILNLLADITGRPAPSLRIPVSVALAAGLASEALARLTGREAAVPLEGVRMARHVMFVDASKAREALGFRPGPIEPALSRAVRWYVDHGYVSAAHCRRLTRINASEPS